MATDARNHTVPAAAGHPARADILSLALGIRDLIPVANTTARAAVITAMASAGVSVSTSNPVFVYRADARPDSAIEVTTDGTTWKTIALGSGLQTYTPVLTAPTTNPTLGAGSSQAGNWYQFGPWVLGTFDISFGSSGAAPGSGTYEVSLPPIAAAAGGAAAGTNAGSGEFVDASPLTTYPCSLVFQSTTTVRLHYQGGTSGLSSGAPVVPAVNDKIHGSFFYLAA